MTSDERTQAKHFMKESLSANSRVDVWLDMAAMRASPSYFGNSYVLAIAYLAQHIGTLEQRSGGTAGNASSKSEGRVSISFSTPSSDDSDLGQTSFGLQYLSLLKSHRSGPMVTGMSIL